MSDSFFVRKEMLDEQTPPASTVGVIGWLRANLFSSWFNTLLTLVSIYLVWYVLSGVLPWVFLSVWNAESLTECREIAHRVWNEGREHACWAVINERWTQLLFGFYPSELYWRPILAFLLLFVAIAPILFYDKVPTQLLYVTAAYPFVMPWLMWGGSVWTPLVIIAIIASGYFISKASEGRTNTSKMGAYVVVIVGILLFTLASPIAGLLQSIFPLGLEPVISRDFGGFMLSILIGVVAIGASFPLGVLLALGRQSDLPFLKVICVGFIEFIRGVPLITLLFVASTLLNIFLPPGTNFDIIVRVMIMVTLFSAAYMAEVVRGGLAALPRGQYEGADSLGLNYWQAQRLIIMPQALKISIPGIVSTFIGVFKDTTLVSIIGLLDPLGVAQGIRANQEWNGIYWELFAFIALLFFIMCFGMSRYSMYLERKLKTDNH